MSNKLLTIIVPCFNMEQYLVKCLESLGIRALSESGDQAGRTSADLLDVIVVNDGSADKTSVIAHSYADAVNSARTTPVIRVVDKKNGHYGSCINVGVEMAAGQYVKILEPDDTYDTQNFHGFLQYLIEMSERRVDVVLSELARVDENGKVFAWARHTLEQGVVYPISKLTETKGCVFNGGLTYRTQLLRGIGYRQMEGVCYSDTQWYLIPLCHAKTMACFPKIIYRYFTGRDGQSMSRSQYARNTWMMEKVALDLLENHEDDIQGADAAIAAHVRRMIYECLLSIYVACIVWKEKSLSKTNLQTLDDRLKVIAPDIYAKIGAVKWANSFLPYHYVKAWREGSKLLPIMTWLCRHYSNIMMGLVRFRGRAMCGN